MTKALAWVETSGNPVTFNIGLKVSGFLNFQSVSGLQYLCYYAVCVYVRTYVARWCVLHIISFMNFDEQIAAYHKREVSEDVSARVPLSTAYLSTAYL